MKKPTFKGPFEVNLEVTVTNGLDIGTVTIGLGKAKYPTEDEIKDAIKAAEESNQLPRGFRLATKKEWWKTTELGHFAMPGGEDWDS